MRRITNVKAVAKKSKTHTVYQESETTFQVTSGASGSTYEVTTEPVHRCNCRWGQFTKRGKPVACSHVQKVVKFLASARGYKATARSQDDSLGSLHRKNLLIGNGVVFTLRRA